MNRSFRTALVLFACIASARCTASYPTQPTQAAPVSLFITQGARGRVNINTSASYQAFIVDADGAFEDVSGLATFESSDTGVARASSRASFRGVAAGIATITARHAGLTASVPMVVVDPRIVIFPRLSINVTGPSRIGGQAQTAAGLQRSASQNEDVTSLVTWRSENPSVAAIAQNGVITGVGIGTTMITATYDGLTDWYWLSINPQ
jgi:Big-like domain-containing protein